MKIKSNRKKRSTRKTRQCKRIKNRRTRRQRGGLKKAEVLRDVLLNYSRNKNDPFITHHFGSHDAFEKLLSSRDPVKLEYLCNDTTTEGTIFSTEFAFANKIAKESIPNVETIWPTFVVHLKKVVEAKLKKHEDDIAAVRAADIERRLFDLKFTTSKAEDAAKAAADAKAASSGAASIRAASSRASSSGASSSGAETEKARREQMIANLDRKLDLISRYKGTTIKRPNFEALYDVSVDVFERIHKKHIEDYDKMISQIFEK